jgi:hypothetical protein
MAPMIDVDDEAFDNRGDVGGVDRVIDRLPRRPGAAAVMSNSCSVNDRRAGMRRRPSARHKRDEALLWMTKLEHGVAGERAEGALTRHQP